jgi:hypothetical protein
MVLVEAYKQYLVLLASRLHILIFQFKLRMSSYDDDDEFEKDSSKAEVRLSRQTKTLLRLSIDLLSAKDFKAIANIGAEYSINLVQLQTFHLQSHNPIHPNSESKLSYLV